MLIDSNTSYHNVSRYAYDYPQHPTNPLCNSRRWRDRVSSWHSNDLVITSRHMHIVTFIFYHVMSRGVCVCVCVCAGVFVCSCAFVCVYVCMS